MRYDAQSIKEDCLNNSVPQACKKVEEVKDQNLEYIKAYIHEALKTNKEIDIAFEMRNDEELFFIVRDMKGTELYAFHIQDEPRLGLVYSIKVHFKGVMYDVLLGELLQEAAYDIQTGIVEGHVAILRTPDPRIKVRKVMAYRSLLPGRKEFEKFLDSVHFNEDEKIFFENLMFD